MSDIRKIKISALKTQAVSRPDGYYEDVVSKGKINGEFLLISIEAYIDLKKKYAPETPMVTGGGCCGQRTNPTTASLNFPPISKQIRSAIGAVKRVVGKVVAGQPIVASENVIATRKGICDSCEFLKGNRCVHCGCFLAAKIKLTSEHCPKDKW